MFKYLFYSLLADSTDEAGAYGEMVVSSVSALKEYKELNCHLFKDVYINGPDRVNQ